MKAMAVAIIFFLGVGSYVALAEPCSANATLTNYHQITGNKYFFAFDVTSTQCTAYPCRGYVKFAIKYHYRSGLNSVVTDNTLVGYTVQKSNTSGHTTLEHYVGNPNSDVVIDDAGVTEVSCSTP
jgi:hypothetical protein